MFKFEFFEEPSSENDEVTTQSTKIETKWAESKEILIKDVEPLQNPTINELQVGTVTLKFIAPKEIIENVKRHQQDSDNCESILNAEEKHSDLITGLYEGGLKIWECTFDLLTYLDNACDDFKNSKVIDLGCGSGLLGIFAHLKGATVFFQDYNEDVIKYVTMKNFALSDTHNTGTKFYSGDWESFTNLLRPQIEEDERFDYILTSETIYNPENYQKLHDTFTKLLKKTGTVYLAAKSHYFGVGGGISQMEDLIEKNNVLDYSTCWNCTEGVNRSILKLTFKS